MYLNLYDNCIGTSPSITAGLTPQHITYLRGSERNAEYSIYTNQDAFGNITTDPNKSFAWLYESPSIMPNLFIYAAEIKNKFRYIFTHSTDLCRLDEKRFKWAPASGPWIGGDPNGPGGGKIGIASKTRLASMLASNKNFTSGHRKRLQLASLLKTQNSPMDIFINANVKHCYDVIAPYMFSFVVENGNYYGYFTEKILNCFAVGTIPVYDGDPDIGLKFDMGGIIHIQDWISGRINLSKNEYYRRLNSVNQNFRILNNKFLCPEDYIYENYLSYL